MSAALDAVEKEALLLSESDRAKLAYELLESLDAAPSDESVLGTVKRRALELESGAVQSIPAEEVFQKARGLLK
ncbi:MAG: addiction module protein [Pseudomonadota bacterium]